ncbi:MULTISPECIES: hypothetical protein [unclassified Arthrobacter]|uniref:hypothetical protein n=1 Tax=unclassified Arthrobacter TaxID=235627 RepID=UPI0014924BEE|nr:MULTISPECIES: hypothetical protein [unclassified Arthrobacter]NOJ63332.1 hypothetical protein [Arthrobacter sp. 147(2020)]
MPRERANLRVDMLADDDFRGLSVPAQHLYMILMIHPTLSYAGVADWRKGRLAGMSSGATPESVSSAARELQASHFIYVDEQSEEVFIRSFVRHDGLLKQHRLPISMANDYAAISSPQVRTYFVHELKRLHEEIPNEKCWENERVRKLLQAPSKDMKTATHADIYAKDYGKAYAEGYADTFAESSGDASRCPTTTATTTATSSKEDKTFSSEIAEAIPRPDVEQLLDLLEKLIIENGFKKPSRNKANTSAARLLIDRDGYTVPQIEWMIRWATNDEFWRKNILSMSKLRDKFPQLLAKADVNRSKPQAGFNGEIDVDAVLGLDTWVLGDPPSGLSIPEEAAWKKSQVDAHRADRLKKARKRLEVSSAA